MPKQGKSSSKGGSKKPKRKHSPPKPPPGLKPLAYHTNKEGKKIPYYYTSFNPIADRVGPFVSGLYLMKPCKSKFTGAKRTENCKSRNITPEKRAKNPSLYIRKVSAPKKKDGVTKRKPGRPKGKAAASKRKPSGSKAHGGMPKECIKVPAHFKAALKAFTPGGGVREFKKSEFEKLNEFYRHKFERNGDPCSKEYHNITPAALVKIASASWVDAVTEAQLKALGIKKSKREILDGKKKMRDELGGEAKFDTKSVARYYMYNPTKGTLTKKKIKKQKKAK